MENNMDIKTLCDLIDENKEELFSLLGSFIKINSENYRTGGNEKELAELIHKLCLDLGLESEIYSPLDLPDFKEHPDYVDGHHLEDRFNVTAVMRGEKNENGLMLMAHTDTVEIGDVGNWKFDPFSGETVDGKILGRGACDDKYGLATVLFIIKLLKNAGFVPKKNLLFGAYCDEEHGGSHGALATVLKYPSEIYVNLDGIENQIWNCASGGQEAKYLYHTENTVDSAESTASAIPVILEVMREFKARRTAELEANPYYKGSDIPKTCMRYMDIRAGKSGTDLDRGELFFTYYTVKSREEIKAEFAELEGILNERLAPLGIVGDGFAPCTRFFHYTHIPADHAAIKTFLDAGNEVVGYAPTVCGSCLSDLSVIGKYGGGAAFMYGCARGFDSPGGAHQANEYISCDALVDFTKTVAAYVLKIIG